MVAGIRLEYVAAFVGIRTLISNSVKMSTVAGNTADEVLRPLVLRACGIDPGSGAPRSHDDFAYIRNDLDSRIREFKAILVTTGSLNVALVHNTVGRLTLAEFDQAMTRHANELRDVRDMIVAATFTSEVRSEFALAGAQDKPLAVSVLLTGGSASLPAVRDLALGGCNLNGFRVAFSPVEAMPDWITSLDPTAARLVGANYPQCAVAIGGSAAELPVEISDLTKMVVAPAPGRRILDRTQITGV